MKIVMFIVDGMIVVCESIIDVTQMILWRLENASNLLYNRIMDTSNEKN